MVLELSVGAGQVRDTSGDSCGDPEVWLPPQCTELSKAQVRFVDRVQSTAGSLKLLRLL